MITACMPLCFVNADAQARQTASSNQRYEVALRREETALTANAKLANIVSDIKASGRAKNNQGDVTTKLKAAHIKLSQLRNRNTFLAK
jgi:hypothetical protein